MSKYQDSCLPIMFETEDADYPYYGIGSSFMVSNEKNLYWVTAAHVIYNQKENTDSLRIFPSPQSKISIPFNTSYTISDSDEESYKDLYMLKVDTNLFHKEGDDRIVSQDILKGYKIAENLVAGDKLNIVAYPAESRLVDYDIQKIKYKREELSAEFLGNSSEQHCFELTITSFTIPQNLNGISGCPIYYMSHVTQGDKEFYIPLLCGIAIRGTSSSRKVMFVSSSVLLNLINKAEGNA